MYTIIGLILTAIGATLLFFFGQPYKHSAFKTIRFMGPKAARYINLSKLGFFLLIAGTLLQLAGRFFD